MLVRILYMLVFIILVNPLLGQIEVKYKLPRIQSDCIKLLVIEDSTRGYFNPDSVLVDTCQSPPVIYVYRWFNIVFDNYVIDLPAYPQDTTIDITWESISTSYTQLRNDFQELESKFGSYLLRKKSLTFVELFAIRFNNFKL